MKVSKSLVTKLIQESLQARLTDLDKLKTTKYANKFIKFKGDDSWVYISEIRDDIDKLRIAIKEIIKEMMDTQSDSNS